MSQVLTSTTDNGSNMLTMSTELDNIAGEIAAATNIEIEPTNIESNTDVYTVDAENQLIDDLQIIDLLDEPEISEDAELDNIFDVDSLYEVMLDETMGESRDRHELQTFYVESIRCAAHTLQLAIKDALDNIDPNVKNVISLCSRVAKILRQKTSKVN